MITLNNFSLGVGQITLGVKAEFSGPGIIGSAGHLRITKNKKAFSRDGHIGRYMGGLGGPFCCKITFGPFRTQPDTTGVGRLDKHIFKTYLTGPESRGIDIGNVVSNCSQLVTKAEKTAHTGI